MRPLRRKVVEVRCDRILEVTSLLLVREGRADTKFILSDRCVRGIPRPILGLAFGGSRGTFQVFVQVFFYSLPTLCDMGLLIVSNEFAFCHSASIRCFDEVNSAILASAGEAMELRMLRQEQFVDKPLKSIANIRGDKPRIDCAYFKARDFHNEPLLQV